MTTSTFRAILILDEFKSEKERKAFFARLKSRKSSSKPSPAETSRAMKATRMYPSLKKSALRRFYGMKFEELKKENSRYGTKKNKGFEYYVPKAEQPERASAEWKKLNSEIGALEGRANAMLNSKSKEFRDKRSQKVLQCFALYMRELAQRKAKHRDQ